METTLQNKLIRGRDVLIIGLQAWESEIGSNCKDLAAQFHKYNRVLYVNYAMDRSTWIKRNKEAGGVSVWRDVIKGKRDGLIEIQPGFWNLYPAVLLESINWSPFSFLFDVVNYFNNIKFAIEISKALNRIGFKDVILFNDQDIFRGLYLNKLLRPAQYIYYVRDYLVAVKYWSRHGKRLEPFLIAKADLVVANSTYLQAYCQKYNAKSFYIGQGCDFSLFNKEVPALPTTFKKPIFGYVGAITSLRLDEKLMLNLADELPDWTFLLVGPEDEAFRRSTLHTRPNVVFLGNKPVSELASYIHVMDVCINPQTVNELTIGNYPRKVDEYLAMGKPVVAKYTEAMKSFKGYTYLVQDTAVFAQTIQRAREEDSHEKHLSRKEFALGHSWEKSYEELSKAFFEVTS